MKRIFCIILIVSMLACSFAVAEETAHYRLRLGIVSFGMEKEIEMHFYIQDNIVSVFSSLFPDTCIRLSADKDAYSGDPALQMNDVYSGEQISQIFLDSLQEWISFMNPEIRTGIFTGDTFEAAGTMEYFRFSYSDFIVLLNMMSRRIKDLGIPDFFTAFLSGSETFLPKSNYQYEMKVFNGGKYYTLNMLDGTDVLITLSLNTENPGNIIMVLGYGEKEKNYYHQLNMDFSQTKNLQLSGKIYADDQRVGFSGISDRELICSSVLSMEQEDDSGIKYSIRFEPANSVPPAVFSGYMNHSPSSEHVLDGKLHFQEEERFILTVSVDRDSDLRIPQAEKTFEMNNMDENDSNALSTEIGKNLAPFMIQLMTSIPEEYMHLILGE